MHQPVDSAWIETCIRDDWASGATIAKGASPACRDVAQRADKPSHPHRVTQPLTELEVEIGGQRISITAGGLERLSVQLSFRCNVPCY